MRENRLEGKLRHLNWMQIKDNLWDLVLNWLSNAALRKTGLWTNTFYKKIHNNFSWQYYDESYIPFVISLKGLLGKNIIPWFQNKPWPRVRTLLGKQPDMQICVHLHFSEICDTVPTLSLPGDHLRHGFLYFLLSIRRSHYRSIEL